MPPLDGFPLPAKNALSSAIRLRDAIHCIKGDHAGSDASPGESTRRSLRPVMSIDQICDPPPTPPAPEGNVRVNMMTRPFGAQVGPSSSQPCVRMRSLDPSGRITPTPNSLSVILVKAMRSPRGLQTGVPFLPAPKLMR